MKTNIQQLSEMEEQGLFVIAKIAQEIILNSNGQHNPSISKIFNIAENVLYKAKGDKNDNNTSK